MKKLQSYLARPKAPSQKELADRMEVHPSTVCRMVKGELVPTVLIALALEDATDGYVKCRDWQS